MSGLALQSPRKSRGNGIEMPWAFSMDSSFGNFPMAQVVARFHLASCSPPVHAQLSTIRLFDTTS